MQSCQMFLTRILYCEFGPVEIGWQSQLYAVYIIIG
jgi:hypothetical protein